VIDEMLKNGYNLGGEQSGHLIFRDYGTTGDGLVAALQILRILKAKDNRCPNWRNAGRDFPQLVTNVKVREKKPFEQLDGVEPAGGRSGKGIAITRRPPAAALFRAPNPKCAAGGGSGREGAGKVVETNLRVD
jgi:hypothetical protein